jgi:hypothetical protein
VCRLWILPLHKRQTNEIATTSEFDTSSLMVAILALITNLNMKVAYVNQPQQSVKIRKGNT